MLLHEVEAQIQVEVEFLGDSKAVHQTSLNAIVTAVIGVIVCTIFPLAIRYGTGTITGIYPVSGSTHIENSVIETMGLVTYDPVGQVEHHITNQTKVVEVLGNECATIELARPVTVTESGIVASPGCTLDLLIVNTETET